MDRRSKSEYDLRIEGREGCTEVEETHIADIFNDVVATLNEEV
jgi:hypothetical protein